MTPNTDPVRALAGLAERAVPFLRDEAAKYDDDGSNEPLELAREIETALASLSSDESALPSANSAFDGGREAALASAPPSAPDDVNRLVRELDVALNGPDGAAAQASLCDLVSQVQRIVRERAAPLLAPSAPVGALSAIAGQLRLAGAALPAPQVQGTPESGVITGLSIALALVESAIAQQPAAPSGEAVAWLRMKPDGTPDWAEDCIGSDDKFLDPEMASDGYYLQPLLYPAPQQPAGVEVDTVRSVAQHIANAADYIDKVYPGAETLDAGVILRNMRRWHERLTAALAAQQQGGAA